MPSGAKKTFLTGLTDVHSTDREGVGVIRQEGNNWYKWVNYVGGTGSVDGVDGDLVFYTDDTGYEASQVMQDLTDLSGKALTAGTLQAAIDISTFTSAGAYCWIKIKGADTLANAIESSNDASPVTAGDGDPLVYGDADGAARRDNTVRDAAAELMHVFGYAIDATANVVLLDCPF